MRTVRDGGWAGTGRRPAGGVRTTGRVTGRATGRADVGADVRDKGRAGLPGALRTLLAAGIALLAALAAAGCGGDGTNGLEDASPAEIGSRTLTALGEAPSLRVVSEVTDPASDTVTRYDLRMTPTSTQGFVEADGIRVELVKIDGDTYVRGDEGYYASIGEADAAELLAGRWVRLPADRAAAYTYYTIEGIALAITDYVAALSGEVSTETVGDRRAVLVTSPEGTRLWAANTGEPYPLRLEMAGSYPGMIEFSEYGAEVAVEPPPDPIDLARLG